MAFILIKGILSANDNPFAAETPILRPVNDPGPELTATAFSLLIFILEDAKKALG